MLLGTAFWKSIGTAPPGTTYASLANFVGHFDAHETKEQRVPATPDAPPRPEAAELVAQAIRAQFTPVEAEALISEIVKHSVVQVKKLDAQYAPGSHKLHRGRRAPVAKQTALTNSASGDDDGSEDKSSAPRRPSFDSVSDKYEGDLSKYLLDKSVTTEGVTLRVVGISLAENKYIVKFSVTNNTSADLFVKDVALVTNGKPWPAQVFFRLFVEPGNTRAGFLLFDRPLAGVKVKIALKEDREKGRVIETPVEYPF